LLEHNMEKGSIDFSSKLDLGRNVVIVSSTCMNCMCSMGKVFLH
jgi:hypothetical protein